MKISRVWIVFFILFIALFSFSFSQKSKIDTDFFSLIQDDKIKENSDIYDNIKKRISKEIIFLIDDKNISNEIILKATKSNLFKKITYSTDGDYKTFISDLNSSKLALFDRENFKMLKDNPTQFFKGRIKGLFSSFSQKLLNLNDDFFDLTQNYGKKNPTKVYLDIEEGRLKVKDKDKIYFFINVSLKSKYSSTKLLNFIQTMQKISKQNGATMYVSGGAIYSALGRQTGERQGLYMSIASLALTALLLLFAFKNIKILYISLVAIFGLSFGMSGSFLFFDKVHILGIVLSTSLIGLMYDFALHWLSFSVKNGQSVKMGKILKIFLLGFFITASGYGIFLFAPFELLNQVAIFSIFALFGAFVTTYFLLPSILQNTKIKANKKALSVLSSYENFLKTIYPLLQIKPLAFVLILVISFYTFSSLKFVDNIKDYASTPANWLHDAKEISRITNVQNSTDIAIVKGKNFINKEMDFVGKLKDNKLISNYKGIDQFFLSKKEQEEVKSLFKKYKNDEKIISLFTDANLDKNLILNQFDKITNEKTHHLSTILKKKTFSGFAHFLPQEDKSIIYLYGVKDKSKIASISKNYSIVYADFVTSLNKSFENLKIIAIKLKIYAYGIAFILLALFFGFKRAFLMITLVLISTLLALFVMGLFGFFINIFAIYGLILASAVGIDYMIFALNNEQSLTQKLFGITLASLTTFISFFIISFSNTPAVSVFGVSVSICVLVCSFFASILALSTDKINKI